MGPTTPPGNEPDETPDQPFDNWIDLLALPASEIDAERLGRCDRPPADYRGAWQACTEAFLDCAPPLGVFVDGCGCGCGLPPADVPRETATPDEPDSGECPGPGGALAVLESKFERLVIGEDSLFLISASAFADSDEPEIAWAWQVDKLTARMRLVPLADAVAAPGSAVAHTTTGVGYGGGDPYAVSDDGSHLLRASSGPPNSPVLPLPDFEDQCSTHVLANSDFYATSSSGSLWHAQLGPGVSQVAIIEQQGAYDDDDYRPLLGVDPQAVYWQAAHGFSERVDGENLTLFRTCR